MVNASANAAAGAGQVPVQVIENDPDYYGDAGTLND